jgi:predicted Ser/Thr protein kinase
MKPLGAADPSTIATYRLLGVLGSGGMGRVYLAESPTGRRLAIKVIRADLADNPVFRRRFAHEVAAVRAVSPLFTAAVVDADTGAPAPWLATTFIDGPSLEHWVGEHGPLAAAAVLTLAAGLAEALASIHRAGLVHRDLKPGNVLLNDAGPHIIDFGIALAPDSTRITTSLIGTPSYMAPERLRGAEAAPAADIFSLGATLAFAATGRRLAGGDSMYEQILQMTAGRFDLSTVPAPVRRLVAACVSRRAADRPTADELARLLAPPPAPAPGAGATDPPGKATTRGSAGTRGSASRGSGTRGSGTRGSASRSAAVATGSSGGVRPPEPGWYRGPDDPLHTPTIEPTTMRLSRRRALALGGAIGALVAGGGAAAFVTGFAGRAPAAAPADPVLWRARSGAGPRELQNSMTAVARIAVDPAGRVITSNDAVVFAVDTRGRRQWARTLAGGPFDVRLWGSAVLVNDARQAWLLDAATGSPRFSVDLAGAEESRLGAAGGQVRIRDVALLPDRAFVDLSGATVAIDRGGRQVWRAPAASPVGGPPADSGSGDRPADAAALAVDPGRLVALHRSGSTAQSSLYASGTGAPRWSTRYDLPSTPAQPPTPPPFDDQPPPGSRSGPPPDGPPPGAVPPDSAWQWSEARLGTDLVVLRNASSIQVRRAVDGGPAWADTSDLPIAAMEIAGSLLLVAADRLTAYDLATGAVVGQADPRGARLAVSADGRTAVAVTETGISTVDPAGRTRVVADLSRFTRDAVPDRVTLSGTVAYLTLAPRDPGDRPLDVDVLAVDLSVHPG